jgi:glucose-6-phosphate isomerase
MASPTAGLLTELPSFDTLTALSSGLRSANISRLFEENENRVREFTLHAAGLTLDFSKHLLDRTAHAALVQLGSEANLHGKAAALFAGDPLNSTENRPALHTLLRATQAGAPQLEAKFEEVSAVRQSMKKWADKLHGQQHRGHSGELITDVVNIGIGGSDLGPRLVTDALKPFHGPTRCHYVANVDPHDLADTLAQLQPASTLFIICSKSFNTEETLSNALAARRWMLDSGADASELNKHFLATTTNLSAAQEFGIAPENCLPLWDWVGGRYSVWSAVGLSCAIAVGWQNFAEFLAGAKAMDHHFADAEESVNMPMTMSLLEVWYCNFLGNSNHVVLPYAQHLRLLPDFLQQLTMESNGKRVSETGQALGYDTGPVLWGSAGTMGQHSFHQLLHQGTRYSPADFIAPLTTHLGESEQHRMLVANCFAQSRTLMVGRSALDAKKSLLERGLTEAEAARLAPHLAMPGNRPSSTITMESLTPQTLGALIALYEHRTFCSGQLWGINPFDQWGVELGKEIGREVLSQMAAPEVYDRAVLDPSTAQLLARWQESNLE